MLYNLGVFFCKGCNFCLLVYIGFDGICLLGINEENKIFIDLFNYNDIFFKVK